MEAIRTTNEIVFELKEKEKAIPRTSERTPEDIAWEEYQRQNWVPLSEWQKLNFQVKELTEIVSKSLELMSTLEGRLDLKKPFITDYSIETLDKVRQLLRGV